MKEALVNESQNGVQNRGVGFKNLIQKSNMSLGQFMIGYAAVIVLLQGLEAHGAKDLLRGREAGEEPLKIICAFDAPAHLVRQHRLGGAGRPDDEHVMRREERSQRSVDQIGPLEKDLP